MSRRPSVAATARRKSMTRFSPSAMSPSILSNSDAAIVSCSWTLGPISRSGSTRRSPNALVESMGRPGRRFITGRPTGHAPTFIIWRSAAICGWITLGCSRSATSAFTTSRIICALIWVQPSSGARQWRSAFGIPTLSTPCAGRWALGRIALHSGPRPIDQLGDEDVDRLLVAVRKFSERSDLDAYWTSGDRYRQVSKAWITKIGQLRLVLYHRGQVHEAPRKIMPSADVRAAQPAMGALVDKWLERRAPALRPATVYHHALTARRFLDHLAVAAPEVRTFAHVKHDHVISWMNAMATDLSPKTGRPLTTRSQRERVIRLAQFFKDAEDWAWPGVPRWPLVARRDLPRTPECIPRYIPRADLDRLMDAIRALPDPFQRAAMIAARWSGARRSEVRRLTTDCLDSYADGTARLRIPVGKTARERMIPLHDEAVEALRAVLAIRADVADRQLPDERTGELVRFVFVWRGKLMSERHLFGTPLERVCEATGLVDATGKPTITMHRFRHTLGTELAERGAKLHTIMSILGHESPQMTMVYARISDAEVLRDYRSVLEPGAMIAGAGAEAIRAGTLSAGAVDWLRTNFLKTELELGHCLRLPSEGPCECDLYLSCSRFVTTPAYAPRLRERHRLELSLADDARERVWPREVERHCAVARRIAQLLVDLGEGVDHSADAPTSSSSSTRGGTVKSAASK